MSNLLYVGFSSKNTHVQASDKICFPAILEGVKGSIDIFRDVFRLYHVMGLSNASHWRTGYNISDIGHVAVHVLHDENTDIMFDFSNTVIPKTTLAYNRNKSTYVSNHTCEVDTLDAIIFLDNNRTGIEK